MISVFANTNNTYQEAIVVYCLLQSSKNWEVKPYHGSWVKGVTAGGCGAPPHQGNFICFFEHSRSECFKGSITD